MKKGVLRNFTKFTGKQACSFVKKETLAQVFPCEFWEISKNTFFTNTWMTASTFCKVNTLKQINLTFSLFAI